MVSNRVSLNTTTSLLNYKYIYRIVMEFVKVVQNVQVNLCQKLFFLQNMGKTCCVQTTTVSVKSAESPWTRGNGLPRVHGLREVGYVVCIQKQVPRVPWTRRTHLILRC